MNTAIIAEYNPVHNGHVLHIEKTRKLTGCKNVIVIMSGNFVQRGEPAIFEKHIRTCHALMNGADMVLELPVEYATGAADVFAGAAVELLDKSGIVDALCFGSEEGDTALLDEISEIITTESEEFGKIIKKCMSEGKSYPTARAAAVNAVMQHRHSTDKIAAAMNRPNNILAIEYLAALKRLNSRIIPYTVRRESNDYNDTELSGACSSAAAIRHALKSGCIPAKAVPENTLSYYKNAIFPDIDRFSLIFSYILRTTPPERLAEIADITDGLENRFLKYAEKTDISEIIAAVKAKNCTYTKLQRSVLHIILGITKEMQRKRPGYIRVLGVRHEKKHLINRLFQKSSLPVITRVKENEELLKTEIRTTDIYRIITDNKVGEEYKKGIITV